jgi:hypothetical protein
VKRPDSPARWEKERKIPAQVLFRPNQTFQVVASIEARLPIPFATSSGIAAELQGNQQRNISGTFFEQNTTPSASLPPFFIGCLGLCDMTGCGGGFSW